MCKTAIPKHDLLQLMLMLRQKGTQAVLVFLWLTFFPQLSKNRVPTTRNDYKTNLRKETKGKQNILYVKKLLILMVLKRRYLEPALLAQNHNLPGIKENLIIHQTTDAKNVLGVNMTVFWRYYSKCCWQTYFRFCTWPFEDVLSLVFLFVLFCLLKFWVLCHVLKQISSQGLIRLCLISQSPVI